MGNFKGFPKKALILVLALALTVLSIPYSASVDAAAAPAFKTTRKTVYENGTGKGVYTYIINNMKKGYHVEWSITGTAKKYVSLSKDITLSSGSTVTNKITIDTKGASAAKNKRFIVWARVYSSSGKLIKTLADKPTIKISAEDISIVTTKIDSLSSMSVNTAYDFDKKFTPANSTSRTYWSVKDASGNDCSSQIDSMGVWTPVKAGEYTVTATAKNSASGKAVASRSVTATVGDGLKSVKQIASNMLTMTFSNDVKKTITLDDIDISNSQGTSTVLPKSLKFSADGKTVTVTTYTSFADGVTYSVTYKKDTSKSFQASVGKPQKAEILTSTAPAGQYTPIEYAIYDSNGIDVKDVYPGTVSFDETLVTNGYLTYDNQLFLQETGKSKASVKMAYEYSDGSDRKTLTATKTVTCADLVLEDAAATDFTITDSSLAPNFDASNYKAVTSTSIDDTSYAHFRALDADGKVITYNTVKYSSSNENVLIASSSGKLTPVKTGSAKIIVTVSNGSSEKTYVYNVTVREAKKLGSIKLSTNSITMSNVYVDGYEKYIDVEAYDQFGQLYSLKNKPVNATITENSNQFVFADFDSENSRITIKPLGSAGTYNYTLSLELNGTTVKIGFVVYLRDVPSNGAVTYRVEFDTASLDMAVTEETTDNKTLTIRLAEYKGGYFNSYIYFNSATVKKGNSYYTGDLTGTSSSASITLGGTDKLVLTTVDLNSSNVSASSIGECKKAETGNYTVMINYTNSSGQERTTGGNFTLKDTQTKPSASIDRLVSTTTVSNALDLVNNCIRISDGTIYTCTVAASAQTGSNISVASGEKLYIKTVGVKRLIEIPNGINVKKVYVYQEIEIGQTLQNK